MTVYDHRLTGLLTLVLPFPSVGKCAFGQKGLVARRWSANNDLDVVLILLLGVIYQRGTYTYVSNLCPRREPIMTTIQDAMRIHCDTCGLTKYLNIIIEQSENMLENHCQTTWILRWSLLIISDKSASNTHIKYDMRCGIQNEIKNYIHHQVLFHFKINRLRYSLTIVMSSSNTRCRYHWFSLWFK